jgi:hypothetical protein
MDWSTPSAFEVGAIYVEVTTDEVLEFVGRSEVAGLADLDASPNVLMFRRLVDGELRMATELGLRRGEHFQRFVDDGIDEG